MRLFKTFLVSAIALSLSASALAGSPVGNYRGICDNGFGASNATSMKVMMDGNIMSVMMKNDFTTETTKYDLSAATTTVNPYGFKSTIQGMSATLKREMVEEFEFTLVGNTATTRSYVNVAGDAENGGITKSCTFAKNST